MPRSPRPYRGGERPGRVRACAKLRSEDDDQPSKTRAHRSAPQAPAAHSGQFVKRSWVEQRHIRRYERARSWYQVRRGIARRWRLEPAGSGSQVWPRGGHAHKLRMCVVAKRRVRLGIEQHIAVGWTYNPVSHTGARIRSTLDFGVDSAFAGESTSTSRVGTPRIRRSTRMPRSSARTTTESGCTGSQPGIITPIGATKAPNRGQAG